jgi:hypothetical protein
MSSEDPRYADSDPRSMGQPGPNGSWRHAEIVPRPGGTTEPDRTLIDIYVPPPDDGPAGGPGPKRRAQVPRSLLILLVSLLVIALLAIVVLVALRKPASTPSTATNQTTSPSASATSASAASTPASSPAASATGTSAGPSASPTTTASSVAAGGGGPGAPVANLSSLTVLSSSYVANLSSGPEQIGAVTYQNSVGFTCETAGNQANFVYDVAGYKYLTAVVGVPSDATNAAGNAMTITFFKDGSTQLGQPITVSLDHPQSVHLSLQDASQLQISCNATNVTSHQPVEMDAALGNATIGPS